MPKFKCSFSITTTIEKTYTILNHEVNLSDQDCQDYNNIMTQQAIKDSISDKIYEIVRGGDFKLEQAGKLIETRYSNSAPEFIKPPYKI
jgi:hypothetical protein